VRQVLQTVTCDMSASRCLRPYSLFQAACTPDLLFHTLCAGAGVLCIAAHFSQDLTRIFHNDKRGTGGPNSPAHRPRNYSIHTAEDAMAQVDQVEILDHRLSRPLPRASCRLTAQ
jgi:hypothetical protein